MENTERICARCGCVIDSDDEFTVIDDEIYCDDCVRTCNDCGDVVVIDDGDYNAYGDFVCESCIGDHYVRCDDCDEWVLCDDATVTAGGSTVCEGCLTDNYIYCEDCGEWTDSDYAVWNDEGDCYYCEDCADRHRPSIIYDYHEFDDWRIRKCDDEDKYNNVIMGIELEVEKKNSHVERNDMACQCEDILGDLAVYMRDGSLDNGFEMISHPMSYKYWTTEADKKFTDVLKCLSDNGYKSHDTETCGLHIHVDKSGLATDERTMDEVIDNIILIMETFKVELTSFSRRKTEKLERWARFLTSERDDVSLNFVKQRKVNDDKYLALNLRHYNTIEFRIFRGTLLKNTLYASLELVKNIVNIAKYEQLDGLTWKDVINYHSDVNKHLTQYNNERGIDTTTKIQVYDYFETHKDEFTIQNFIDGKYMINLSSRDGANKICNIKDMLWMIALSTKGKVAYMDTSIVNSLRNCGYALFHENELRASDYTKYSNWYMDSSIDYTNKNYEIKRVLELWQEELKNSFKQ